MCTAHRSSTCHERYASPKIVRKSPEHKVSIRGIKGVGIDEVVKALRHQTHGHAMVQHTRSHFIKDVWLHHMIAIHHHQNVFYGYVVGLSGIGINLLQYDMVEIRRFSIQLTEFFYAVADIEYVAVSCKMFSLKRNVCS